MEPQRATGILPEASFDDPESRNLRFATNHPQIDIIRVRAFDVATFVAFGAAQIGIAGNDVLMEFDYPEIYAPLDLGIGICHLAVAEPAELAGDDDPNWVCAGSSSIWWRVAPRCGPMAWSRSSGSPR